MANSQLQGLPHFRGAHACDHNAFRVKQKKLNAFSILQDMPLGEILFYFFQREMNKVLDLLKLKTLQATSGSRIIKNVALSILPLKLIISKEKRKPTPNPTGPNTLKKRAGKYEGIQEQ